MTTNTLHDRLFKEFLYRFLPDFLTLFFPDKAAQLDFNTLTFLDKELVINTSDSVLRIPDVVAEVQTFRGEPEVIIIHVEVEARNKSSLPHRLFEYYALLRILRQKPILPIALVLLPNVGGLGWKRYQEELFGQKLLQFYYGQIGIRDLPSSRYLKIGHPVAATLATLMKTAPQQKAVVKLIALQTVMNSPLNLADQAYLVNLIQTYLPKEEIQMTKPDIITQLAQTELSWSERLLYQGRIEGRMEGRNEGEAKGRIEGKRDLLLYLLTIKFGVLPTSLVTQLHAINNAATFDTLSEQLLKATTLSQFMAQVSPLDPNLSHS